MYNFMNIVIFKNKISLFINDFTLLAKYIIVFQKCYTDIKNSDYFWLERMPESTVEDTVANVEKHFGLVK